MCESIEILYCAVLYVREDMLLRIDSSDTHYCIRICTVFGAVGLCAYSREQIRTQRSAELTLEAASGRVGCRYRTAALPLASDDRIAIRSKIEPNRIEPIAQCSAQ